jgi:hypothetical protein
MKSTLFVTVLACILFGCVKPNDQGDPVDPNPPVDPPIPTAEMVNTELAGYALRPDNSAFNNTLIYFNQANWPLNGANFSTTITAIDRYATRVTLNDPLGVEKTKTIALTNAGLNYVRLKPMSLETMGTMVNGQGATYSFAGTGSIVFPPNSIYRTATPIYPGYYGPDIQAEIRVGYLSPLSPDFGISIPCYSFADDNNKRVFLASAGIVNINAGWINPITDAKEMDIWNSQSITVKIPIPAGLPSPAPDTIPSWRLHFGKWVRAGSAVKTGNIYTMTITTLGIYNLAIPAKGVYRTIRLKTDNGIPIINAALKVKYSGAVVAESQTDWDGNAFMFLPADQSLSIEVYKHAITSDLVHSTTITTDANTEIPVTMNSASQHVYPIKGNGYSCNGTALANGKLILNNQYTNAPLYIPVSNGSFNRAILFDPGSNYLFTARLANMNTNDIGSDTGFVLKNTSIINYNFNTCKLSTELYMNYTIDGVATSITGDMSINTADHYLGAYQSGNTTMIVAVRNGTSIEFRTNAIQPGVYTGSGISGLFINNTNYNYDFNQPMRVTFDRYDLLVGGFVTGSADFYYKDQGGVSHHIVMNFKVKRAV